MIFFFSVLFLNRLALTCSFRIYRKFLMPPCHAGHASLITSVSSPTAIIPMHAQEVLVGWFRLETSEENGFLLFPSVMMNEWAVYFRDTDVTAPDLKTREHCAKQTEK